MKVAVLQDVMGHVV